MEGVSALLARCPTAGLAGGLGVTACAAAGVLLYRIARRTKPTHTTVNCWFCDQDTVVPYGNRNCWDCPHCEQYNGFQENGDYNKPIPAQYLEHLNHVVSSAPSPHATATATATPPQQWVSSQVLLCRRCSHHQTTKVKQLAAFSPRDESRYDEEIEVYRHHLEQIYKLCRPCQAAVEHYIKHQNRQLRALLLSHQFKRREADQGHTQSFCSSAVKAPVQVIVLRALAFLACAFLLATTLYGTSDPFAPGVTLPPALPGGNGSATPDNGTAPGAEGWRQLLGLLPEHVAEKLREAWAFGRNHRIGVVVLGLLTCLLAMLLAGRIRLRRIDAFSTCLWALLLGLHLAEQYLQAASPSWLDTLKLSAMSLCCLVGFTAAVATRKAMGPRRFRPRRYLPGDSAGLFPMCPGLAIPCPSVTGSSPSLFLPTPAPRFLPLGSQQLFRSPRRASPSSLPGRLSRALSLGTIPSLTRADSGYLFSGSRPPSQVSRSAEVPVSDYFSLLAGSCPSPLPSPAPSVASSVASSSGSLRHRRPLISPARLNLKGQKLLLFPSLPGEAPSTPSSSDEHLPHNGSLFSVEPPQVPQRQPAQDMKHTVDMRSMPERASACGSRSIKKEDDSSQSSTCVVDTTTRGCSEEAAAWRGHFGPSLVQGLLAVSLAANALFTSAYLYQSLR